MTASTAPAPPSWRAALPLVLLIDLTLIATSGFAPFLLAGAAGVLGAMLLWSSPQRALAFVVSGLPLLDPVIWALGPDAIPVPIPPLLLLVPLAWIAWSETWMESSAGIRRGWFWSALRDPVVLVTALFAAVLYAGLRWTSAPGYGGEKAFYFLIGVVLLIVATRVLLDRGRDLSARAEIGLSLLTWLVFWETALALFGVWNYFSRFYDFDDRLRVAGLNTIWLARHMGMGLLALFALRSFGRISKGWSLSLAALFSIVFYLAGSRGPLAALVPSLALWWILEPKRRGHARLFAAVSFSLIAIAGLLWFIITGAVLEESPFAGHDASNLARLVLLKGAFEHLPSAGWLGYGTGAFGPLIGLGDTRIYPHNIFLELWVENGILGLAIFVVFLAMVARRWRNGLSAAAQVAEAGENRLRDILIRTAGVQWFFALACAQFSGDLPQNPWIWLWAGALAAWSR
jgi:O-antigen ligase